MEFIHDPQLNKDYVFLGRRVIYTSHTKDEINKNTIPSIVSGAMSRHLCNRGEIKYLFRYFRGYQPILDRVKLIRPDVNNRIVINNAYSIVRNATGYFLGEPIQYTAKLEDDSENVQKLNAYMDSENKSYEDMSIGNSASICGTAYRLVAVDDSGEEDEAPFEIPTLEPQNTFVIYSTEAGHEPLLGVTYSPILNDDGSVIGTNYIVYDGVYQYVYSVKGVGSVIKPEDLAGEPKPHFLGSVPIVEYPNNEWRIGDFESVMIILNAINKLNSDRVNSVEQIVNSILVFIGCHLKTAAENKAANQGTTSDLDRLKEELAIELPSADGKTADVKYVNSNVNQNEAETLAQTLIDYVYAITGIPDRKGNASGGSSDTGDAVYLRDGYQSLEVVARVKERNFKKAERQTLRMVCKILKTFDGIDLKPMQVDVKFIRNRTNNLVNKSQALSNLHSTGVFSPEDEIQLIGVTDDPKGMAQRGQAYKDSQAEKFAAQSKLADSQSTDALDEGSNPDGKTDGEE